MIVYKINVLETLTEYGYNPYRLRKEKLLGENTIQKLREGKMIGMNALDRICKLLDMQPGNVIRYTENSVK